MSSLLSCLHSSDGRRVVSSTPPLVRPRTHPNAVRRRRRRRSTDGRSWTVLRPTRLQCGPCCGDHQRLVIHTPIVVEPLRRVDRPGIYLYSTSLTFHTTIEPEINRIIRFPPRQFSTPQVTFHVSVKSTSRSAISNVRRPVERRYFVLYLLVYVSKIIHLHFNFVLYLLVYASKTIHLHFSNYFRLNIKISINLFLNKILYRFLSVFLYQNR